MEIESGDCKHVMDDRDLKRERRGSVETEVSQHCIGLQNTFYFSTIVKINVRRKIMLENFFKKKISH